MYARYNHSIFITVKFPISSLKEPLKLFYVIALPVPINETSDHATHLLGLPKHFAISANQQFYTTFTNEEIIKCSGNKHKYCSFNKALTAVTTDTCIQSLFSNIKDKVHSICDFRFVQDALSPKIIEINPVSVLVYRSPLLSLECLKEHKMLQGCDFYIINLPCQCSISTPQFYLAPRLTSCHNESRKITKLHPFNLVLLQEFFASKTVENVFADITYLKPMNVSISKFKIYKHKISDIIVNDQKAHLNLSKMADNAKKDEVIFQSLTDPLLNGNIAIDAQWPDLNALLILITMTTTILSSLLMIWTLFKM